MASSCALSHVGIWVRLYTFYITDLITEDKDAVHLPAFSAGPDRVWIQHDVLQVAHHGVNQGGQGLSLQRLQEGLVQVLCGVAMARIKAVMSKGLKNQLYNFSNQDHAKRLWTNWAQFDRLIMYREYNREYPLTLTEVAKWNFIQSRCLPWRMTAW